jgi:hypothetical protein
MKMKKIIAICLLLLLMAVPNTFAEASSSSDIAQNNRDNSIILTTIQEDGTSTTEEIISSEEEIVTLKNTLSTLIQRASFAKNWQRLQDIISNLINSNNPILSKMFKPLIKFRPLLNRALVISLGHNFKFNPFKNNLKIRKKLGFWHYSSGKIIKDRTIIFKPLALKLKVLSGAQIGFMARFVGIYIFIPRKIPEKSFTFFMGTARRIKGFQALPSI